MVSGECLRTPFLTPIKIRSCRQEGFIMLIELTIFIGTFGTLAIFSYVMARIIVRTT
jgi:hypothetical protein